MKRWLYVNRYVRGEEAVLQATLLRRTNQLLFAATDGAPDEPAADGSFTIELSSRVAGLEVTKRVRVATGVAFHSGPRVLLPVSWQATPGKVMFPSFEGTLELEQLDKTVAALALAGSYRTPLGPVGGLADASALRRVAQATAERLVDALGRALEHAVEEPSGTATFSGPRRGEPLRVSDVMTADPIVLDGEMSLRTATLLLFHGEISGAPVVNQAGELLGVLSERDLLVKEARARFGLGRHAADEDRRREARTVGEACTRPARVTVPDARLTDVARAMLDHDVSRLVVLDEGRVAGIISRHDVLAALLRDDAEIEYAIQQLLDAEEMTEVRASVHSGEVWLSGRAPTHSRADELPARIAAIDGVLSIDADLTWEEDDVIPPVPHM